LPVNVATKKLSSFWQQVELLSVQLKHWRADRLSGPVALPFEYFQVVRAMVKDDEQLQIAIPVVIALAHCQLTAKKIATREYRPHPLSATTTHNHHHFRVTAIKGFVCCVTRSFRMR
jgi:hypothetical protein